MLHIKREGQPLRDGLNFYPLSDPNSAGFVLRYGSYIPGTELGDTIFIFRYAKLNKKWIIKSMPFKERK